MTKIASESLNTIHYMNGVIASGLDASKIKNKIGCITNQKVRCHHNPTTPLDRVIIDVGLALTGAIALTYAIKSERKRNEKLFIGAAGTAAIAYALYDYAQIQEEKNQLARKVARSVKRDLRKSCCHTVTLVLHSQGADIGNRMLEFFTEEQRKRIQVITLGGMIAIPNNYARVTNFQFQGDFVSKSAQTVFNPLNPIEGTKRIKPISPTKGFITHGAEEYIDHPEVKKTLKDSSSLSQTIVNSYQRQQKQIKI